MDLNSEPMTTLRSLGLSIIICAAACTGSTRAQLVTGAQPTNIGIPSDTIRGDDFEGLLNLYQSGMDGPLREVVRDSARFIALWRKNQGVRPRPKVDFTTEEVIVVVPGRDNVIARVSKIERRTSELAIFVVLTEGGRGCINTDYSSQALMVRHRRTIDRVTVFYDHFTRSPSCPPFAP